MTPYEQARQVYEREECARSFEEDLIAHLHCGYVVNTPEVFGMFRPIYSEAPTDYILDPYNCAPKHMEPDCWHIWTAAGDLSKFIDFLPYELQWISFERKNKLRFRSFHQMAEKLSQHGRIQRTSLLSRSDRTRRETVTTP